MSGLYLWAPRLLFMWQLLWLLIHAAPARFPKLALDPVLLTSISPEENEPSPTPQEIPAQEPEASEVGEPYSTEEEASTQSAISPKLLKSLFVYGVQEELPTTPENTESSIEQKSSPLLQLPLASVEPSPFRQKGPGRRPKTSMYLKVTVSPLGLGKARYPVLPYVITPQPPKNIKVLATAKEVSAYFAKFTEAVEPPSQEEFPPKLSETTKSSSSQPTSEADATAMQLTLAPPEHPQETLPHREPVQAQQPTWSEITGWPLNLELTIKPEATVEGDYPAALQQTLAPPEHPHLTLPYPEPVQAQQPSWSEITGRPSDLELTIKPEATVEGGHPTAMQQTTAPPEHPQETLPHREPVQAQQPSWSEITGRPSDLELTIKPEATVEGGHPTAMQQTTAPPEHPQVTLPLPEPVQAQLPSWSETTGRPLDLELTIKPEAAVEGDHPAALQQTTAPPEHPQVTLPRPEPVQPQQPTWSEINGPPLSLELSIRPEASVEDDHPAALQQTTAPPEHPQVTLPRPQTVYTQHLDSSQMISPTLDEQFIRFQHPVSSETGPPTAEQNAIMNVCELCTCNNETLSCTGFGPKQRLHRVPVPQPNTYNGTFTVLNLKGNSISQFDKDTWKSYHETEKLILSDNNLRELRKESFEGLLFLKYLDLSGNNIKFIEESTFETLPFLEYLNLGGNLLTEVSSGMFRAWHGMQFLHTIILHHNPLTTIEDSYLFKLPALQYIDLGTTQVSLTTVENILTMSTKLEKLILPRHLACCLCHVKNSIETVSQTVRLHCDTECLTKTRCAEEEPHLTSEEGSFLKVIQDRKNTSAELMIEPERTSSDKNDDNLSAFLNLLMKLLSEQEEAKVSKAEWDTNQWENEKTEAPDEEEEEEPLGRASQVPGPGYGYKNKVLVATPVIAVATGFIIIACLILICGKVASKEDKEGKPRGFFSSILNKKRSQDSRMEAGGFWSRLKGLFGISRAASKKSEAQTLQEKESSDENELLDQMEKGEGSTSTARTGSLVDTTTE
ncbi:leucine-rich repeat-containing protein 37A-like [Desmodus rotundus]|uniref:leucine-rich repeat-containing protein 37A-like n=1 Tax=Desmodus rotundus TaxID=9430 RepID=UPI002380D700|nr:leucine-rich repeat-containing protein 37A-like [Desmodus rotundus]